MRLRPGHEPRLAESRRDVHAVEVQLGGGGEDAHGAHDGDPGPHDGRQQGQSGGDAREVEGDPRAPRDDEVAKDALGQVGGPGVRPQGRRDHEAEGRHHARDERREDVPTPGGPVGRGRHPVRDQANGEEEARQSDVDADQRDHETASLAQLHGARGDHASGGQGTAAVVGREVGERVAGGGGHGCSPKRLVTSRNHVSSEA